MSSELQIVFQAFGEWLARPETGAFDAAFIRANSPTGYGLDVHFELQLGGRRAGFGYPLAPPMSPYPDPPSGFVRERIGRHLDELAKRLREEVAAIHPGPGAAWGEPGPKPH